MYEENREERQTNSAARAKRHAAWATTCDHPELPLGSAADTPFLRGREDEFNILAGRVANHTTILSCISGPTGSGTTTLLHAVEEYARRLNYLCVRTEPQDWERLTGLNDRMFAAADITPDPDPYGRVSENVLEAARIVLDHQPAHNGILLTCDDFHRIQAPEERPFTHHIRVLDFTSSSDREHTPLTTICVGNVATQRVHIDSMHACGESYHSECDFTLRDIRTNACEQIIADHLPVPDRIRDPLVARTITALARQCHGRAEIAVPVGIALHETLAGEESPPQYHPHQRQSHDLEEGFKQHWQPVIAAIQAQWQAQDRCRIASLSPGATTLLEHLMLAALHHPYELIDTGFADAIVAETANRDDLNELKGAGAIQSISHFRFLHTRPNSWNADPHIDGQQPFYPRDHYIIRFHNPHADEKRMEYELNHFRDEKVPNPLTPTDPETLARVNAAKDLVQHLYYKHSHYCPPWFWLPSVEHKWRPEHQIRNIPKLPDVSYVPRPAVTARTAPGIIWWPHQTPTLPPNPFGAY